jgi:hypothetical protein
MSLYVSVEDEEGDNLAPVIDIERLPRRFKGASGSVCLRFVSEEEDASFNRFQLPVLVSELDSLGESELKTEERQELVALLRLVRRFQDKPKVHVRFYGEKGGGE